MTEHDGKLTCLACGGMGTTTHDIMIDGTEHDTEERDCVTCKTTGRVAEIVEHWDDIGLSVIFTMPYSHAIEFKTHEIVATQIKGEGIDEPRGWTRNGGSSNLDLVYDPHGSLVYIAGHVKWDGCCNVHIGEGGYMHLCGAQDIERLSLAFIRIFNRCGELMRDRALKDTFPAKVKI